MCTFLICSACNYTIKCSKWRACLITVLFSRRNAWVTLVDAEPWCVQTYRTPPLSQHPQKSHLGDHLYIMRDMLPYVNYNVEVVLALMWLLQNPLLPQEVFLVRMSLKCLLDIILQHRPLTTASFSHKVRVRGPLQIYKLHKYLLWYTLHTPACRMLLLLLAHNCCFSGSKILLSFL